MEKSVIKYYYISKSNHYVNYSSFLVLGLYYREYYFLFVYSNNPVKKNICGTKMKKGLAEFYLEGL